MASGGPVSHEESKEGRMHKYLASEKEAAKVRLRAQHTQLAKELEQIRDDGMKELDAVFDCLTFRCNNEFSNLAAELRELNISEEKDDSAGLERKVGEQPVAGQELERLTSLSCVQSVQQTLTFYDNVYKESQNFYTKSIFPCGRRRCKTCRHVGDGGRTFRKNSTEKDYHIIGRFTCESSNVIYLISCSHPACLVQYVGSTEHKLSERMNQHRQSKSGHLVYEHFKQGQFESMQVKVIDQVYDAKIILVVEEYWIRELNTLNDKGKNLTGLNKNHAYAQWDALPEDIRNASTADTFKSLLYRQFALQ